MEKNTWNGAATFAAWRKRVIRPRREVVYKKVCFTSLSTNWIGESNLWRDETKDTYSFQTHASRMPIHTGQWSVVLCQSQRKRFIVD